MLQDFALFVGQHNSDLVRYIIQELCMDIFLTMSRMINDHSYQIHFSQQIL